MSVMVQATSIIDYGVLLHRITLILPEIDCLCEYRKALRGTNRIGKTAGLPERESGRMSTIHLKAAFFSALTMVAGLAFEAQGLELKPYKDQLFAYPGLLEEGEGGAFLTVDYQELRDINKRDEIPERRVRSRYVSLAPRRQQAMETLSLSGRPLDVLRVGEAENARFAVIFVHGRGGDRRLGANDFTFGGNFNRIKNLAVENGGVYYAPSIKTFDGEGVADLSALINEIAAKSPQVQIVVSCASMGSILCWSVAREDKTVGQLAGMMIMGGVSDADYSRSAAYKARLPLFFSHGSNDSVYAADEQKTLFNSLLAKGYPARFVLFQTGSHGTPVRMTDWRDSLNWIFKQ